MNSNTIRILAVSLMVASLTACGSKNESHISREQTQVRQQQGTIPISDEQRISYTEKTVPEGVYLERKSVAGLTETQLLEHIRKMAADMDIPYRDAVLDPHKWRIKKKEKSGKRVNVEKTAQKVLNGKKGDRIRLVVEKVKPGVTAKTLRENIVEVSRFTTPLVTKKAKRTHNIQIAADKINYLVIAPGEEFSFNGTVGKRTKEKGYEKAPIYIKTKEGIKKKDGLGGGICQLSTTLYNAVLKGRLEIMERHEHSKEVPYVEEGKDATVAYWGEDLRFRNNRPYPVMLRTFVTSNRVSVRIYENRNPA